MQPEGRKSLFDSDPVAMRDFLGASIRRIWFFNLAPGRVCGKFVPNRRACLPNLYCLACGYDVDAHHD